MYARKQKERRADNLRQIDYVMIGMMDRWRLHNVYASDDLYVSEDHRTITAELKMDRAVKKRKKHNVKSTSPRKS